MALVVPGPADAWPWTPSLAPQGQRRATSSSNAGCRARGPELSARPRWSRHQPSPSIRAAGCAPGPFGISWRSADPGSRSTGWIGAQDRSTGWRQPSMWAHSRFLGRHAWLLLALHHIYICTRTHIRLGGPSGVLRLGPCPRSFALC